MTTVSYAYAVFGAGEVEVITGVSQPQQRKWRRAGYISSGQDRARAHARFSLLEVAEIAALGHLVGAGMLPGDAGLAAKRARSRIMAYAIVAAWAARRVRRYPLPVHTDMERFILTARSGGAVVECDRLDNDAVAGPWLAGAPVVIVMDCQAIGRMIQQKAQKPLCEVEER